MALGTGDRPALVVTAVVAVPVAVGLLWTGAGVSTSDAVLAAVFLVAWLLIALPVAVLVGRWIERRVSGLDEEEQ